MRARAVVLTFACATLLGTGVAAAPSETTPGDPTLADMLRWLAPIQGTVTSPYGPRPEGFHDALDIAAPMGAEVIAPTALRIDRVAYQERAGRYVSASVMGPDGKVAWRLTFAHLSSVAVFEGDTVARGETLGRIGLSGSATGAHLHFRVEVIENGERIAIDPTHVLPPGALK